MRGNRASPSAVRRLLAALHELGAKVAMALIALHIAAAALQGRLLRDGAAPDRSRSRGLARQADHGPEAAQRALVEGDVAAVAARDVAGDGQAQAHALLVLVPASSRRLKGLNASS